MNLNRVASVVIAQDQVNYCKTLKKGNNITLEAMAYYDFSFERMEDLKDIFSSISSLNEENTLLNLSIMSSDIINHIYFYKKDAKDIRSNVMRDLKNDFGLALQEYLIDFEVYEFVDRTIAFVVAMPKALFDKCYGAIKPHSNIKLFSTETDIVSLRRLVNTLHTSSGMKLCFNFSKNHTGMFVIKEGAVTVVRNIQYGFEQFVKEICERGGVDRAKAISIIENTGFAADESSTEQEWNAYNIMTDAFDRISIELQRTIDFATSTLKLGAIDHIITLGFANRIKKADVYISKLFSMQTEKLEAAKIIEFDSSVDFSLIKEMNYFDTAIGAALRRLD